MWNRLTLKNNAKNAIRANYWKCVLVALIAVVILSGSVTYSRKQVNTSETNRPSVSQEVHSVLKYTPVRISVGGGIGFTLLGIFVFNILEIGCDKFFIDNASGKANLGEITVGFRSNYGRNVLTMFLIRLYIALWSLLLVIPGVVKAYSYSLVPYILADSPDISRTQAIELSKKLMDGNKMEAFILDLSFIGWEILSTITGGIVGVFYVNPYVHATKAELYLTLRYGIR